MKIFVSSVMNGFDTYREAAFAAIESLDHHVIRAEDFPSSTSSSRIACMQGVREADLVVLLLGERYGWSETETGLSPTHEEFREAKDRGKALPFIQTDVVREPQQNAFVAEVEDYDSGLHRGRTFATPEQLRTEVTRAIARHQLVAAATPVEASALLAKAELLIPRQDRRYVRSNGPLLHLAVVGGPNQSMLRPSEIEDPRTADDIVAGLTDGHGIFSYRLRTTTEFVDGALVVQQENGAAFRIDEEGSLVLSAPIEEATGHMKPLIEENVRAAILKSLTLADQFLDRFDETQRLTRVVIVAHIGSDSPFGWRTSSEQATSPGSITIPMRQTEPGPVHLNPPDRTRMALRSDRTRMADDILALLRRQHRGA
jgi:hypothetical protein